MILHHSEVPGNSSGNYRGNITFNNINKLFVQQIDIEISKFDAGVLLHVIDFSKHRKLNMTIG